MTRMTLVADAVSERDEFASPEEAALSVRESALGATDHEDPHPEGAEIVGISGSNCERRSP